MTAPDGYRIERGLLWPAADRGLAAVVGQVADLEVVYPYCDAFDVAVQAGGACGVWPAALGLRFATVYTFEPDPVNFRCLCANAPAENIVKLNAALGDRHELVDLSRRPENAGAHFVQGDGTIPVLLIDDLALDRCDLICLDIEGYEARALRGAVATIRRCRPVVMIEDKGCSERYGTPKGHVETWLAAEFGYRVVARPHRDVVMAP